MEERERNIMRVGASSRGTRVGCSIIRPKEKGSMREKKAKSLNLDHCTRNQKRLTLWKSY